MKIQEGKIVDLFDAKYIKSLHMLHWEVYTNSQKQTLLAQMKKYQTTAFDRDSPYKPDHKI